jgi:hypothetical protein
VRKQVLLAFLPWQRSLAVFKLLAPVRPRWSWLGAEQDRKCDAVFGAKDSWVVYYDWIVDVH